ncbi:phosphoethanolamine transferase [Ideonella sp. BN130291]|uniref:phosphoethanolamine transferase n=1 Tax=Ideonella sp. BN130291 TaxID=3112940 RepID=UPI002E26BEA9|nr:phosphoethanolamine--lipid A transferase [Ideonella sp. BN130291]
MISSFLSSSGGRWWSARPQWRVETLALVASLFFALACNGSFWAALLAGRTWDDPATWLFAAACAVGLVGLQALLLLLLLNRYTAKPLLALLFIATAFAVNYMRKYSVFLDPSMMRNVLRTDVQEARELLGWSVLPTLLLFAGLPLLVLWRVRLKRDRLVRATLVRAGALLLALLATSGAVWLVFQDLSSLIRNQKEVRYLITPGNYLVSLASVLRTDTQAAARPRTPIGTDATLGARWAGAVNPRPLLVVLVVGETARAANWGLNGYARQTTPELASLPDLINFPLVDSCGTNTETSLPCMFSPWGRRQYDESRIRGSESLLHVLQHAGVGVLWRDNQSGCKGVCEGLPQQLMSKADDPALCDGERCLDEILLHGLDERLRATTTGPNLMVLHQLGNHGPAYFKRYPSAYRRFQPACESADLRQCKRDQIVNAYDNAILYTDHVLAQLVAQLRAQADTLDSVLLYVSDHGESLGENNLYLHGLPYAIAPREQTRVPMVMWLSAGYAQRFGLDPRCLRERAAQPAHHDNLFHTVLGLLDVRTQVYEPKMDLAAACRH